MTDTPLAPARIAEKIDDVASLLDCAEVAMSGLIAEGVNSEGSAGGIRLLIMEVAGRLREISDLVYSGQASQLGGGRHGL